MSSRSKSLGPIIAVYRQRPLSWVDLFTWGLLGVVAVLVPLGYGYIRRQFAYTHYGPVAAMIWSRPWYLLAIFALFAFIALALYRLRFTRRFIAVHKQGLRLALSDRRSLRYSEIAGIASSATQYQFLGLSLRTRYFAKLFPNIGKPIRLDDSLQNLPELLTYLKAQMYPRLSTLLRSNFSEGKWLHFGPISIQRQMIQILNKQYTWSQIEQISVDRGKLIINTNPHSRYTLPVARIPNIEILLQIIQHEVKA
jgi:hypothetical protein